MSIHNELTAEDQNRRKYYDQYVNRSSLPYPHTSDILRATSYHDPHEYYDKYSEKENKDIKLEKRKQYYLAFGIDEYNKNFVYSLGTQFAFMYIGALVQARKQFIPGFLFFRNSHYNWIGALKYIALGGAVGALVMTFNFGQPFFLEDVIRNKLRNWTRPEVLDKGVKIKYINYLF